jgi:glutathione S-transferase
MTDTTTITEEDGLVLDVTRRLKASRQRVFDAWSSLDAMKHWFGPENCSVLGGSVDFQVGGRYRLEVQTETLGPITVGGEYREISPPDKLAFSWKWEGHEELCKEEMEVVIEFTAINENETELRLTQTGFPEREVAEHHGQGWNGTFDKLGPWLASA